MYFFTQFDPDYKLKGSRDPLGFQSIWSNAGHKLIAHLSTVSSDLNDFQILTYAHYWYYKRSKDQNGFVPFFIKLEQAFSYARKIYLGHRSFNGTTAIFNRIKDNQKAIEENTKVILANNEVRNILSNQRTYGIYGKYIRPFRDMKITEEASFNEVIEEAIQEKSNEKKLNSIIDRILNQEEVSIFTEELQYLSNIIIRLTQREKQLFIDRILQTNQKNHNQDLLFKFLNLKDKNYIASFKLFEFINELRKDEDLDDRVKNELEEIENTERVISVLNAGFIRILNKHSWTFKAIDEDSSFWDRITTYQDTANYNFKGEELVNLKGILSKNTREKVEEIVERNLTAKKSVRNGRGWIEIKPNNIVVLYGQTNYKVVDIDFNQYSENNYFIDTYLGLYNQILEKGWKS
jgi:hypothetical protein